MPGTAMVFAPIPVLTVTVGTRDGTPDIRLRAGGRGCRLARVLTALDVPAVLCGCLGGDTGPVLRHLLEDEGLACRAVERSGRNGTRVRDRRGGSRTVAESPGDPLTSADADLLHEAAVAEGTRAAVCVLSRPPLPGPAPAGLYRRLARDLRAAGGRVVADLAGEPLAAALAGGVDVLRADQRELGGDGGAAGLVAVMRGLRAQGAGTVVVTRTDRPALALIGDEVTAVPPPGPRSAAAPGAGERITAGIAAGLATGLRTEDAVRLGVAAGALETARRIDPGEVRRLAERVELHEPAVEEVPGGSGAYW